MSRKNHLFKLIVFSFFAVTVVSCKKGSTDNSSGGGANNSATPVTTPVVTGTPVTVWMTTGDQTKLLERQPLVGFSTDAGANSNTVTIDESIAYQTIDGYGFTLTEGSAKLISSMSADTQSALLADLFNPSSGIGISVLRLGVGATDMSESIYTYRDGASTSFSLSGPDLDYTIPVLKKILAVNPDIKVLATAWSAPVSMKSNGSFTGGTLRADSYDAYGQYWLDYMNAMKAQGITIWAITPQNEPENANNTPSMTLTKENELGLINSYIGPKLRGAGFNCKIIGYDHNCDDTAYPTYVAMNSTYVDGSAFHLYSGNISAMTVVQSATNKNVYFTEQYTASTGDFSGDLMWHIQNVVIGSMNNWGKTALEWNLANDPAYGPHTSGGCSNCKGAVTLNGNSTLRNVAYYIIAHAAKFVKPNASRISSNSVGNILTSAFKNPDGSKVLIAQNMGASDLAFKLKWGSQSLTYNMPAKSVATFTW